MNPNTVDVSKEEPVFMENITLVAKVHKSLIPYHDPASLHKSPELANTLPLSTIILHTPFVPFTLDPPLYLYITTKETQQVVGF